MPTRNVNNSKLWQRRSGRESLFHWTLWLIGIAIFCLLLGSKYRTQQHGFLSGMHLV